MEVPEASLGHGLVMIEGMTGLLLAARQLSTAAQLWTGPEPKLSATPDLEPQPGCCVAKRCTSRKQPKLFSRGSKSTLLPHSQWKVPLSRGGSVPLHS